MYIQKYNPFILRLLFFKYSILIVCYLTLEENRKEFRIINGTNGVTPYGNIFSSGLSSVLPAEFLYSINI